MAAGPASVRRATPADAGVLATLLWDFNTEFASPVDPVDVLAPRFERILGLEGVLAFLVAPDKGFALVTLRPAIWFDGPVAQLEELYVVPALRGRGLGTALLEEARRQVRKAAAPEMHIGVDEDDLDARRFYERHGFRNIERGSDFRMLYYIGEV